MPKYFEVSYYIRHLDILWPHADITLPPICIVLAVNTPPLACVYCIRSCLCTFPSEKPQAVPQKLFPSPAHATEPSCRSKIGLATDRVLRCLEYDFLYEPHLVRTRADVRAKMVHPGGRGSPLRTRYPRRGTCAVGRGPGALRRPDQVFHGEWRSYVPAGRAGLDIDGFPRRGERRRGTGDALYSLHECGIPPSAPHYFAAPESFNDWGGGRDVPNLSPVREGTARKHPLPETELSYPSPPPIVERLSNRDAAKRTPLLMVYKLCLVCNMRSLIGPANHYTKPNEYIQLVKRMRGQRDRSACVRLCGLAIFFSQFLKKWPMRTSH